MFFPDFYLYFFGLGEGGAQLQEVMELATHLLKYCAAFAIFDGLVILFSAHLKGAGDTSFVMSALLLCGGLFLVLPSWMIGQLHHPSVDHYWGLFSLYLVLLCIVFGGRLWKGPWRTLSLVQASQKL